MKLLLLKGFNNYFNRKIKKYSDLADYKDHSNKYYDFTDINFNPNDGVSTVQVIGSENQKEDSVTILDWENEGSPDYLVCYNTVPTIIDDEETAVDEIVSRWFVMESVRTRAGQYQLALKRDVIADHLEQILVNPCFVEKGYVSANNQALIFNEEGNSFNQIKQSEHFLTDETNIPWIVMYIAKNYYTKDNGTEETVPIEGKMVLDTSVAIDYSDLPWSNLESGISTTSTNITRRVKGASEIRISPICCKYIDETGVGKYTEDAYRANLRFYYRNNDWFQDNNLSKVESIGGTLYRNGRTLSNALRRKDINISTNSDYAINYGDDGRIVATYHVNMWQGAYNSLNGATIISNSQAEAQQIINYGGLKDSNVASNKTNIKTYLNSKRTAIESNTSHSTVPGETNMQAYVGGEQVFASEATLLSYNNKIVKSGVNYFRIKISRANNYNTPIDSFTLDGSGDIQASSSNSLSQYLLPASYHTSGIYVGRYSHTAVPWQRNTDNTMVETRLESGWFDIQYERVQGDLLRFTLPTPTSRNQLNDAAYDMICFPYGEIDFKIRNEADTGDLTFTSSKEASIGIARSIAAKLGDAVYDVQLLPYCPYRQVVEKYVEDELINLSSASSPFPSGAWSGVYKINNSGDTPSRDNSRTFGLWCISCHDTFDINYTIETPSEDDAVEYKLFSACKKFRLVSPNYSSAFDFNPLKNNGVTKFNVDFTYKPYNPYIHIAPFFNTSGLYGVDTNDSRGLILQGDFSVGYWSDKWANYQINNANYANIFNRQLENIDFNQGQEREKFKVDRITEGITEVLGLGGGMQGAKAFSGLGPWGMLGGGIGGTVGGITGHGVGTHYDKKWMEESMKEERSYAIDMYNLNLGNVKALPYGLAKSDALTENFKFFPFVEVYDCTDTEKEIFRDKIKYDGMSVGAIGKLGNYLPTSDEWEFQRLKGRLIMIDNIIDDFHISDAIFTEVNKGFYYVNPYEE